MDTYQRSFGSIQRGISIIMRLEYTFSDEVYSTQSLDN